MEDEATLRSFTRLSPGDMIRVKTMIADEWRKVSDTEAPSTPTKDSYSGQYSTDLALITGLLIEAISRLDALTDKLTPEATRTQAPAPTLGRDSIAVSPVVWRGTGTP